MGEMVDFATTIIRVAAPIVESLSHLLGTVDLENLSKAIGSLPVKKEKQDWHERIKKTREFYRAGNLVLVLGAGISVEHGLPDWRTLLQSLLIEVLKNPKTKAQAASLAEETIIQIATLHSTIFLPSPLIAARFLRAEFADEMVFLDRIRQSLYAHHEIKYESKVFREIAQLCAAPGKAPSLDAVLNFNFDDILERYLKRLDIKIPFEPVYAPGFADSNKLAIYHPHGYLTHEGSLDSKIRVVLSEQDYHAQYESIYDWSNLIQINKYAEKNCLFLGISLSDPNLRRLLDIGRELRGADYRSHDAVAVDDGRSIHHYIVRRRYRIDEIKRSLVQIAGSSTLEDSRGSESINEDQVEQLAGGIVGLQETMDERDAASFGIGTLWVDEWGEIPNVLQALHPDSPG